jgi:hypothetical protein
MLRLIKRINEATPYDPYLPNGGMVQKEEPFIRVSPT